MSSCCVRQAFCAPRMTLGDRDGRVRWALDFTPYQTDINPVLFSCYCNIRGLLRWISPRTILPLAHGAYHTTAYEVQYILLVALQSPRIARMKRTQPPQRAVRLLV
jgi:hypothetical protein